MDSIELGATRDSSGRFRPGASGNPAGKKPGTRNRKTVLAEALRDDEDTSIARVVIDKALAGDAVTARFLLGLMVPKPRGREITLDLPEDAKSGDVAAAFDATLVAMAAGEITPEEALIVTKVLDAKRHLADTPNAGDIAEAPLHSACISPPAAPIPGIAPRLPRHERRRLAAQRRAAAAKPRRWA